MLRVSVFALFVVGLFGMVARPEGKDDPLQKDLANLKGYWQSAPIKDGDKTFVRILLLGKGDAPIAVRHPGVTMEPFKELTQLDSAFEKDKKRYLRFFGLILSTEHRVEYELSGDKLKLKGSAGGLDMSGEYTRHKKQEKK